MGKTMSFNDQQVGGNHYRKVEGEQHWDRQWRLYGKGYFIGCITKYVERYPEKNGLEDLYKALHFLEKLISLEKGAQEKVKDEHQSVPLAKGYVDQDR